MSQDSPKHAVIPRHIANEAIDLWMLLHQRLRKPPTPNRTLIRGVAQVLCAMAKAASRAEL